MLGAIKNKVASEHTPAAERLIGLSMLKYYTVGGICAALWLTVLFFLLFSVPKLESIKIEKPRYGLGYKGYGHYQEINPLKNDPYMKGGGEYYEGNEAANIAKNFSHKDFVLLYALHKNPDQILNYPDDSFMPEHERAWLAFILLNWSDKEKLKQLLGAGFESYLHPESNLMKAVKGLSGFMEKAKRGEIPIRPDFRDKTDIERFEEQARFISQLTYDEAYKAFVATKGLPYIERVNLFESLQNKNDADLQNQFNRFFTQIKVNNWLIPYDFQDVLNPNWPNSTADNVEEKINIFDSKSLRDTG